MKKHRETKLTSISREVKKKVYVRDGGKCIVCGRPGLPEAHYIRRSHGGLGIEENIVTMCRECHREFDEGKNHEAIKAWVEEYLDKFYPDFPNEKRVYSKFDWLYKDWSKE